MGVRDLDFQDPCECCVIRMCCSKICDLEAEFFTFSVFESTKEEFLESIQNDLLSCRGISVERISVWTGKKKRK